jgi:hypothetical protein
MYRSLEMFLVNFKVLLLLQKQRTEEMRENPEDSWCFDRDSKRELSYCKSNDLPLELNFSVCNDWVMKQ